MSNPPASRRAEALRLAEELLTDLELSRLPPPELVLKTSRLARLLDDEAATRWLNFEISGYTAEEGNVLGAAAWAAATYSNRVSRRDDGQLRADTATVAALAAQIEGAKMQLTAAADRPVSVSSANPNQFVMAPGGNAAERGASRNFLAEQTAVLQKVMGALHGYVASRYQELRFGSAVESAFEVVRAEVDAAISALVPDALPKISAAFENASSTNPEHWANAASTCRRLLKDVADQLRPPGPDVDGHRMDEAHYINRLMAWIAEHSESETAQDMITSDLAHLGKRLEAAVDAGNKGAHSEVSRIDASRFISGTYLLLADVLRLRSESEQELVSGGRVETATQELGGPPQDA